MNSGVLAVGIIAVIAGFFIMAIHPSQRGGIGHGRSRASGPVWFVVVIFGFALMAVGAYLPG